MFPKFLLEETTIHENGEGQAVHLGGGSGDTLLITLGITRIIEQQSLDVSIWGSADGSNWGSKPLATYPQKFYCGTYQIVLDLSGLPDIAYVQARWQANRWGKGDAKPLFSVYLFVQTMAQDRVAVGAY